MSFTGDIAEIVAKNESGLLSAHTTWARMPLGKVATVLNGFPFESNFFKENGGEPLLRIRDISGKSTQTRYDGPIPQGYWVVRGDLVVGMDGDFNCARWRGDPALLNQRVCKIIPNPDLIHPSFLFRVLGAYLRAVNAYTSSTTVKHLSSRTIAELPLPFPPLQEQARIADKLDALLRDADACRERLDRVPQILKRFREAVLEAAYTGKLTAEFRRATKLADVASAVSAIDRPPRPNRFNSMTTKVVLGDYALAVGNPTTALPEGWRWTHLLDVARMESGHTPSRGHPEYWEGSVPWVGIADARDWHGKTIPETKQHTNALGLANSAARLLPAGTVCLSRTASVGYVVRMGKPMSTSQDFANWICTSVVDPDWLKYLFVAENQAIWRFGEGTTHTTVYFPQLLAFHVALPPIEEQQEVVRRINELFACVDSLQRRVNSAVLGVDALAPSILAKAFRGELVPQDPNDEPAEKLLARIAAARSGSRESASPRPRLGREENRNNKTRARI